MKKIFILSIILLLSVYSVAQKPDLSYFLEKAKANSPLINRSKNESLLADIDLKQIQSILSKPEINIESAILFAPIISHDNNKNRFQFVSDGATDYTGYDLAATEGGQYQAVVSVKQPLFTGTKYRTYSEMTDISRRINENNVSLTIHETEQIVTYQYLLCLKSKMEVENSASVMKELEGQIPILKKLVENGISRQTDLMLLQIEYKNYDLENRALQSEYRNNLFDLNLLCGINDTSLTDIQETEITLKQNKNSDSQFLTSYKLDSLNILSSLAIEELKYKPEVGLFADAGMNAVYIPAFNRLGFSTGITFTMNLFDGNQKKMMRDKAAINLNNVGFEKNNFITQNTINKNKTLRSIRSLDERLSINEQQSEQYKTLFDVYSKELSAGEISVMDYKNLLKDIVLKKHERILILIEKQMLINSFNYWNY
jgi:outer membrane protein TolC